MKPGRELDALIAEKVMGRSREHLFSEEGDPYYDACVYCYRKHFDNEVDRENCTGDPRYSTDIADAWEVVEHLRVTHHRDALSLFSPGDDSQKWFAHFAKKWPFETRFDCDGSGETAPHAICLAALNAVRVEIDQSESIVLL